MAGTAARQNLFIYFLKKRSRTITPLNNKHFTLTIFILRNQIKNNDFKLQGYRYIFSTVYKHKIIKKDQLASCRSSTSAVSGEGMLKPGRPTSTQSQSQVLTPLSNTQTPKLGDLSAAWDWNRPPLIPVQEPNQSFWRGQPRKDIWVFTERLLHQSHIVIHWYVHRLKRRG